MTLCINAVEILCEKIKALAHHQCTKAFLSSVTELHLPVKNNTIKCKMDSFDA